MNNLDINLISVPKVSKDKATKLRNVRIISFGGLFLVLLISTFVLFLNFISPLSSVKTEQAGILSQITAQQAKAAKLAIISERVSSITKVKTQALNYTDTMDVIFAKKPTDATLFGLDVDDTSLSVTLNSSSLLSLNNFLNSLIDATSSHKEIKSVFLDNLSVNNTASLFSMTVKVNLK